MHYIKVTTNELFCHGIKGGRKNKNGKRIHY